jgi:hypothetical protein
MSGTAQAAETIEVAAFRGALLTMLEEVFAQVHRYTLDPGTPLLETLAGVSAEEASRPVFPGGATIAAQVNHVCFYIDGLLELVRTGEPKPLDWA